MDKTSDERSPCRVSPTFSTFSFSKEEISCCYSKVYELSRAFFVICSQITIPVLQYPVYSVFLVLLWPVQLKCKTPHSRAVGLDRKPALLFNIAISVNCKKR